MQHVATTLNANYANAEVDLLAIAAHRDDVELTCGGTLIKAARQGYRTAVVDLTQGEMGTRGSAATRAAEASRAAEIMGLAARENLDLPDAGIVNDPTDARAASPESIRRFRPRVVIAPAPTGRHPDHIVTSQLVRDACFVAGLAKVAPDVPKHRPHKVVHTLSFRQDAPKPTFVVDITRRVRAQDGGGALLRLAVRRRDAGGRGVSERRAAVRRWCDITPRTTAR